MSKTLFEGKYYDDIAIDSQKILHAVNIHTFRYFPQDRIWMASDTTAEYFGIDKFYRINDDFDGPGVIYKGDLVRDRELYKRVLNGEDFATDTLRGIDGEKSFKVSVSMLEKDSEGKPLVLGGIIEDFDDKMIETGIFRSLSENYYSVFMVDFIKDEVTIYRLLNLLNDKFGEEFMRRPNYKFMMESYIDKEVVEEEREEVKRATSYESLKKELADKKVYVYDYRVLRDGVPVDIRFKAVKLNDDAELKRMALGFTDVSEEKKDMIKRLAFYDSITSGYNYNYFTFKINEENRKGYLISTDIKSFKIVNSVCGIVKGDVILRRINEVIEKYVENDGYYGHVNADHFIFYLPYKNDDEVMAVLDKIIAEISVLVDEENIPRVSPYFGVTKWIPGNRLQVTFSEANLAKHRIKNLKDVYYGFYMDEDNALAIEEKDIEDSFETAMAEHQFEIWYQPKYNPKDNKLTGAEALVRWRKPDGKLVSPGKFIPIYEKNGMIRQLDKYVFSEVCKQQKKWVEEVGKIVPVSVNLSRASLYYDRLVEEYSKIVEEIDVLPELVPIEITETATIDNGEIKVLADKFFNAGFPLHIDDFGTGYSSLSTLNMMRFDTLKLDKSLVDYIGEFGGDKLIKHTVALAKDLGLHVTAEGVENEDQVEFLKGLECDNIQGFYFSRPMPCDFFVEKLKSEDICERYMYRKGQKFTYSGVVETYRRACNSKELTNIDGHAAIQINIEGEGEGAFYVEIGNGKADVQPYEYYERDVLIVADADIILGIIRGTVSIEEAFKDGLLKIEGDAGAALLLKQMVNTDN